MPAPLNNEDLFSIEYFNKRLPDHYEFSPRKYEYKFFMITNREFANTWIMYEFTDGRMTLGVAEVNERDPFIEEDYNDAEEEEGEEK